MSGFRHQVPGGRERSMGGRLARGGGGVSRPPSRPPGPPYPPGGGPPGPGPWPWPCGGCANAMAPDTTSTNANLRKYSSHIYCAFRFCSRWNSNSRSPGSLTAALARERPANFGVHAFQQLRILEGGLLAQRLFVNAHPPGDRNGRHNQQCGSGQNQARPRKPWRLPLPRLPPRGRRSRSRTAPA